MYKFFSNASAVELPAHRLVFFAAPKVASSSIKKMLFEIHFGKPYRERNPDGSKYKIHADFSRTRRFLEIPQDKYKGWTKITLLRDPVERVISAYANRVIDLKILSHKHVDPELMRTLGLRLDPDISYFMKNIDKYRVLSRPIWHHTNTFTEFLGHDLGYFDHVFKFDELDRLVGFISAHTGMNAVLPASTNHSKTRKSLADMELEARQSLLTYCAGDYALLKAYYAPPTL